MLTENLGKNFERSKGTVFELWRAEGSKSGLVFGCFPVELMYQSSYHCLNLLSTLIPTYFYPKNQFLRLTSRHINRLNKFLAIFTENWWFSWLKSATSFEIRKPDMITAHWSPCILESSTKRMQNLPKWTSVHRNTKKKHI